ncbi:MAG: hypothetical protein ACI8S6_001571 [Myxococcota bacterium]|jgi:hypothetical protein
MTALALPLVILALGLATAWGVAAVVLAAWSRGAERWPVLARWTPLVCILPLLAGGIVALSALLPGDPHLDQLLSCHCATSMPSWLHLCPSHPERSLQALPVAVLILGLLLPSRLRALSALAREPRGLGIEGAVFADLPVPTAVLSGWLRPSLVIDRRLWAGLSETERAAVVAHEQGHLTRHDPLTLIVLRALVSLGPPTSGLRAVRGWLDHAESQADAAAVRAVGDPLLVADALLRCARLHTSGALVPSWTGGQVERRISRLLDMAAPPRAPRPDVGLIDTLAIVGLGLSGAVLSPWLHHQVEHLLNFFL